MLVARLCFARFPLMARYSNVIEQAMQLTYDRCHLGSEVACIHSGRLTAGENLLLTGCKDDTLCSTGKA